MPRTCLLKLNIFVHIWHWKGFVSCKQCDTYYTIYNHGWKTMFKLSAKQITTEQEKRYPYMDTPFLTPLGLLFLLCTSDQQQKHKLCWEPSNEHTYQVWFQLVWSFQRRWLKCKIVYIHKYWVRNILLMSGFFDYLENLTKMTLSK